MRPGRPDDLPEMTRLWEREYLSGMCDSAPPSAWTQRLLTGFDWEACARVEENAAGMLGIVLVMRRESEGLTIARIEAATARADDTELMRSLVGWGLGLSRAAGARVAQVSRAAGTTGWLREAGLEPVRPWWRMDRSLGTALPPANPVSGYRLLDPAAAPPGAWAQIFNDAFVDHWRFTPRSDPDLRAGQLPELTLMAVDEGGVPAAIALGEIARYGVDARPQPVGIVGSVGTLPAHRRRGLASWLVAEALVRLKAAGAATASLYVDGKNEQRAANLYSRLGFVVTFDTTVWEATFP